MNSKTNSLMKSAGIGLTLPTTSLQMSSSETSLNGNWSYPKMIKVYEDGDSIVMIYKETSTLSYNYYPSSTETRIYKIIYSCIDGKWNKSERIYGQIIPPSEEQYSF